MNTSSSILNPPPHLARIEAMSLGLNFNMASEPLTGSLLRTLARSKPSGRFLELGTGTGVSTCWMLDGMDANATLVSVDNDVRVQNVARRALEEDTRVQFVHAEGASFIDQLCHEGQTFDFIFADTWPGKFYHLDEALTLLKLGALYIVDDLLPQPNWPDDHSGKVSIFLQYMMERTDMVITPLMWSTGLLIATRI
ncbi:MAG: class I SAM-dependent methyltransferase [Chloroflexi bacterium]|nr:class I SAM-dependent methyltransferase [Chloroflexota bacterium]